MPNEVGSGGEVELPVIDMSAIADPAGERAVAQHLDRAFSRTGFCYFTNIGVPLQLVADVFDQSRRFHALPEPVKRALAMNGTHRGYMAPKTSVIVTSTVARVTRPNFSESLMLMHEVPADDPRYGTEVHGPNQWPADIPGFQETMQAYDAAMAAFGQRLLRPMALALGLDADWMKPFFSRPTTFLRLLHYPPQPVDDADDAFGSAPHTDYGFVTILAQDSSGGLSVRRKDGSWMPAPPIPGTWVVNVGDMLARWTNGRWQSTPHRVKNLSGRDRYSCPFFFDMDTDATIACVPTCATADNPPREPPVRYGDYLMERLNRNYAYRQKPTDKAG